MTQEDCLEYSHQTINSANDQNHDDVSIGSKNTSNVNQTISTNCDDFVVSNQIESFNKPLDVVGEVQVQDKVLEVNELKSLAKTSSKTEKLENQIQEVVINGPVTEMIVQHKSSENVPENSQRTQLEIQNSENSSKVRIDSEQNQQPSKSMPPIDDDFEDPIARLNALRADISRALKEVKEVIEKHSAVKQDPVPFKFVRRKPKRVLTFEEEDHIEVEVKPTEENSQDVSVEQKEIVESSSSVVDDKSQQNECERLLESEESKLKTVDKDTKEETDIAKTNETEVEVTNDSNSANLSISVEKNTQNEKNEVIEPFLTPEIKETDSERSNIIHEKVGEVQDNKNTSKITVECDKSTSNELVSEENRLEKSSVNETATQFRPRRSSLKSSQGENKISSSSINKTDAGSSPNNLSNDLNVSIISTETPASDVSGDNQAPSIKPLDAKSVSNTVTICDKESESKRPSIDDIIPQAEQINSQSTPQVDHSATTSETVKVEKPGSENSINETPVGSDSDLITMTKVPDPVKPVEAVVDVNKKKLIIDQNDENQNSCKERKSKLKIQSNKSKSKIENGLLVKKIYPEINNNNEINNLDKISQEPKITSSQAAEISEKPETETQLLLEPLVIVPSSEVKSDDDVSDVSSNNHVSQEETKSVVEGAEASGDGEVTKENAESAEGAEGVEGAKSKTRKSKSKKSKLRKKVVIKRLARKLSKDSSVDEKADEPENIEKEVEPIVDVSSGEEEPQITLKPIIKPRGYEVGDIVMYADRVRRAIKWKKATVVERITSISYKLEYEGQQKPAHVSYIKKYTDKKVQFGGKEYLEIDYAQDEEEEIEEKPYNIWARV